MNALNIFNFVPVNRGVPRATCSDDHGDGLVTHHWRVLSLLGTLTVAPPQVRSGDEHLDVLEFADPRKLDRLREAVLAAYRQQAE